MCQGVDNTPSMAYDTHVTKGDHMTTITREQATELRELIEDTLEYFCDQEMMSGETAWAIVECIAVAKQAQIKGEIM